MQVQTNSVTMPAYARVWLYTSDRVFTQQEEMIISAWLAEFVKSWNSHGNSLMASAEILYRQIIVFAVDESQTPPSGCSIDKSVALVRQIEKQMGVSLLDGGRVFYKKDNQLVAIRLPQIKQEIAVQRIKSDTPILNTQANTMQSVRENLFVPAGQSWMARYFK